MTAMENIFYWAFHLKNIYSGKWWSQPKVSKKVFTDPFRIIIIAFLGFWIYPFHSIGMNASRESRVEILLKPWNESSKSSINGLPISLLEIISTIFSWCIHSNPLIPEWKCFLRGFLFICGILKNNSRKSGNNPGKWNRPQRSGYSSRRVWKKRLPSSVKRFG